MLLLHRLHLPSVVLVDFFLRATSTLLVIAVIVVGTGAGRCKLGVLADGRAVLVENELEDDERRSRSETQSVEMRRWSDVQGRGWQG